MAGVAGLGGLLSVRPGSKTPFINGGLQFQIRRRRTTLHDQLSTMESNNLRDLLNVRNEDDASNAGTSSDEFVTLASILEAEAEVERTLLEIIGEEDEALGGTPEPGIPGGTPADVEEEQEMIFSLMTLLSLDGTRGEDTVLSASGSGSGSGVAVVAVAEEEEEEEEDAATETEDLADERMVCCVCMVRSKGAAFIACGHTFCRPCSRELWTVRGNCPLCNALILDILDIFC